MGDDMVWEDMLKSRSIIDAIDASCSLQDRKADSDSACIGLRS